MLKYSTTLAQQRCGRVGKRKQLQAVTDDDRRTADSGSSDSYDAGGHLSYGKLASRQKHASQ